MGLKFDKSPDGLMQAKISAPPNLTLFEFKDTFVCFILNERGRALKSIARDFN